MDPPGGRPWALLCLCGVSLATNLTLFARLQTDPAMAEVTSSAPMASADVVQSSPDAQVAVAVRAAAVPEPAANLAPPYVTTPMPVPPRPQPVALVVAEQPAQQLDRAMLAAAAPLPPGTSAVRAEVSHSLARTFQAVLGESGDVVSATFARLFFWDLDVRRDLHGGDELAVVYREDGDLVVIDAASYVSSKLRKTLTAYRFHATGDLYPSWWDGDGREVSRRLVGSPIASYEQVTSLLKDRPTHKGMDFKTPVGSEVRAPGAATILRVDWNSRYNGRCVEARFDDGTLARFLHLSDLVVRAGDRLGAGALIGLTGNTGRSTAPHLHYELEKDGEVVDPVDYHGTLRRTVPDGQRGRFTAEKARLEQLLAAAR